MLLKFFFLNLMFKTRFYVEFPRETLWIVCSRKYVCKEHVSEQKTCKGYRGKEIMFVFCRDPNVMASVPLPLAITVTSL